MRTESWRRAGSSRVQFIAFVILLFSVGTQGAFAKAELPDAPVAKPEVLQAAQESQQSAGSSSTQGDADKDKNKSKNEEQDRDAKDDVPKRILFIIPNFMTENDQPENQGPLNAEKKFNIAWHQYSDYSAHFGNVLQAAISQAANGIPHYGQGWGAFGERFLAQEGDQFTGSMLIYGVLPTVLHEDPRYFRRGRGSAWSRIYYAATRVLITRTDSGKETFNIPQVFGQLGQAGISLTYYAKQDHSVKGLFEGWGVNQFYNIGWNQLKEFTPDLAAFIRRHPRHRHSNPQGTAATSAD